ncbi:prepilin peptidase [Nocardioides gilvus]|uniref:prepilin peptidase n=1 Tax=Nocardioides gilvus TaxID=1735589 RepID=UPI000D749392|nr:A24 family peptidase [Nocardioides gilvus]
MISASLAAGLLAGAGSLLVPALIRAVPEPEPVPLAVPASASEDAGPAVAEDAQPAEPAEPAEPKIPYAQIGAARGLGLRAVIVGALAGALLGWHLGWDPALVFLLPLVPVLVALSIIDWRTQLLPTWVIARTYLVLVPVVVAVAAVSGEWGDLARAGWGWLITGVLYFLLWFINSSGLGYGDVRLSGIIGLALGYLGWGELFAGLYSAFVLGGVLGAILALAKIVDRKGVPFGPFMVAGALVGVLLGPWTASNLG